MRRAPARRATARAPARLRALARAARVRAALSVALAAPARAALLLALALAASCGGDDVPPAPPPAPPATIQGGVVVEPPEVVLGQTATVEIAVVTPPEHRVPPVAAPESVPGLWILSADTPPVRREPGRLVHRTRFLVRARETGEHAWPAQTVEVETPSGRRVPLALAARPLHVVSALREFPDRTTPFGFREPSEPGRVRGFLLPAAFGAAVALAAVALAGYARRARDADVAPAAAPGVSAAAAPARAAEAALRAAIARGAADPLGAADAASAALREFVERATGLPTRCATTEELAAQPAPALLRRRWPAWLALFAELDGWRFRASGLAAPAARDALAARLQGALELVAGTPGVEPPLAPRGETRP